MKTILYSICILTLVLSVNGCGGSRHAMLQRGAASQEELQQTLETALRSRDFDAFRLLHYSTHLNPELSDQFVKSAEQFTDIRVLKAEQERPIEFKAGLSLRPTAQGLFAVYYPTIVFPHPIPFRFGKAED